MGFHKNASFSNKSFICSISQFYYEFTSFNQSGLFPKQNMNKIDNVISCIGEIDISILHKKIIFIKCIIIYKVHNVID